MMATEKQYRLATKGLTTDQLLGKVIQKVEQAVSNIERGDSAVTIADAHVFFRYPMDLSANHSCLVVCFLKSADFTTGLDPTGFFKGTKNVSIFSLALS